MTRSRRDLFWRECGRRPAQMEGPAPHKGLHALILCVLAVVLLDGTMVLAFVTMTIDEPEPARVTTPLWVGLSVAFGASILANIASLVLAIQGRAGSRAYSIWALLMTVYLTGVVFLPASRWFMRKFDMEPPHEDALRALAALVLGILLGLLQVFIATITALVLSGP